MESEKDGPAAMTEIPDWSNSFAARRYGLEPGELQWAWRQGKRTNEEELEWAICDALGMGGVQANPGDGVGCAAHIVRYWKHRAEAAEGASVESLAALERENARLREQVNILEADQHWRKVADEVGNKLLAAEAENARLRETIEGILPLAVSAMNSPNCFCNTCLNERAAVDRARAAITKTEG